MKVWLAVIGLFYLVLGITLQPFLNDSSIPSFFSGWTAPPASVEFQALAAWMGTFGLDLIGIGAVALASLKWPALRIGVIWAVIAREVFGGIVSDSTMIYSGFTSRPFYSGFIVVHLLIIATGLWVLRRASARRPSPPA